MRDVQQKLKKAKQREQKAKQKFDEMVLENENLKQQFEEFRVAAFRFQQEKDELEARTPPSAAPSRTVALADTTMWLCLSFPGGDDMLQRL